MNNRPRFRIRTIMILTAVVAVLTFWGVQKYGQYLEDIRQQSVRVNFQTVADLVSNLDSEIRGLIAEEESVRASLMESHPEAADPTVAAGFFSGGYGGSAETGSIIARPKFSYHYDYSWGPLTRAAYPSETFSLRVESELDPLAKEKPLVKIVTRGTDEEEKVADWLESQFDKDIVDIARQQTPSSNP